MAKSSSIKPKHILLGLGAIGVGVVTLGARKSRAAGSKLPANMSVVDGKLSALSAGASVATGGAYIIVAADTDHWKLMVKMVAARARANPQFTYLLVTLELAQEMAAADEAAEFPPDIWGAVVSILDGEFITQRFLGLDVDKAEARELIETVEGTVPGLEAESMPALPPITAGFFPPPSDTP